MVQIADAPIRNDSDLARALERVNHLIDVYKEETPEADELEVLSVLIEDYENRTVDIPVASPAAILRFVMEHKGLSPADLVPMIGPVDRVEDVLAERRKLTLTMIRKLSEALHIPAGALL